MSSRLGSRLAQLHTVTYNIHIQARRMGFYVIHAWKTINANIDSYDACVDSNNNNSQSNTDKRSNKVVQWLKNNDDKHNIKCNNLLSPSFYGYHIATATSTFKPEDYVNMRKTHNKCEFVRNLRNTSAHEIQELEAMLLDGPGYTIIGRAYHSRANHEKNSSISSHNCAASLKNQLNENNITNDSDADDDNSADNNSNGTHNSKCSSNSSYDMYNHQDAHNKRRKISSNNSVTQFLSHNASKFTSILLKEVNQLCEISNDNFADSNTDYYTGSACGDAQLREDILNLIKKRKHN